MTPGKLKEILLANGWRTAPEHSDTGVDWYAYRTLNIPELGEVAIDCASNEKQPSLILRPWRIDRQGDIPWQSVEFCVTGFGCS